jgi:hypothetical protein
MFEQYSTEHLRKLALSMDNEGVYKEMFKEIRCRANAEKYKNLNYNEILELIHKRNSLNLQPNESRHGYTYRAHYPIEHLFLELQRRSMKKRGIKKLPIEEKFTKDEEKDFGELEQCKESIKRLEEDIIKGKGSIYSDIKNIIYKKNIEKLEKKIVVINDKWGVYE